MELCESLNELAELLERGNVQGSYYYEDIVLKSWILGPGGRNGNCEGCIENADAGEIEEDDFFPSEEGDGPVDEPPLHPNCSCTVIYRDTRRRVYV